MSQTNGASVNYVNSIMKEINSLSDDLYESLMDNESESTKNSIDKLIEILSDVRLSQPQD